MQAASTPSDASSSMATHLYRFQLMRDDWAAYERMPREWRGWRRAIWFVIPIAMGGAMGLTFDYFDVDVTSAGDQLLAGSMMKLIGMSVAMIAFGVSFYRWYQATEKKHPALGKHG